jgi:hypothetical protein
MHGRIRTGALTATSLLDSLDRKTPSGCARERHHGRGRWRYGRQETLGSGERVRLLALPSVEIAVADLLP